MSRTGDGDDLGWFSSPDRALDVAGDYDTGVNQPPSSRAERVTSLANIPTTELQATLDNALAFSPDPDSRPNAKRVDSQDIRDALAARTTTSTDIDSTTVTQYSGRTTNLTADTGADNMAAALREASDELELIAVDNERLADEFESHRWTGMESPCRLPAHRGQVGVAAHRVLPAGGQIR